MTDCQNHRDLHARKEAAKEICNRTRDDAIAAFEINLPSTTDDENRFETLGLPGFASFTKALRHNPDNGLVETGTFA